MFRSLEYMYIKRPTESLIILRCSYVQRYWDRYLGNYPYFEKEISIKSDLKKYIKAKGQRTPQGRYGEESNFPPGFFRFVAHSRTCDQSSMHTTCYFQRPISTEQIRFFPELFGLQLSDVLCSSTVLDRVFFLTNCCNRFFNPLSRTRIRHVQHCRDWKFEHSFTFCQPLRMYSKVHMV